MLYQKIARSNHWFPRLLRAGLRTVRSLSFPAPRVLIVPLAGAFLVVRSVYYFIARVFFCEPFFKSYCKKYGRNLHTDVYFHWVQGRGELLIGDNVTIDGKCSFSFAASYSDRPTLEIGDHTIVGHGTSFTVGDRITVGRHCQISTGVTIFDSPGHPLDPVARREGKPALREDVRPVAIEDDVWIGQRAIILPGVTLGRGSVVAAGSVVMTSVQPHVLVAGNPARQFRAIAQDRAAASTPGL
jgi:acetyltransferase-like isoleucine patch superfamily enzyme